MGQEISSTHFERSDFKEFHHRLKTETEELKSWFESKSFVDQPDQVGFELETWLINKDLNPLPENPALMKAMKNDLVSAELSQFNLEINGNPQPLAGRPFSAMAAELQQNIDLVREAVARLGGDLVTIGILPTVSNTDLSLKNISPMQRFYALNEQIMARRKGLPVHIDIRGQDTLQLSHSDVMLEAAATSLQVHLQLPHRKLTAAYNLSKILSAPMIAASTNSPFLFGKDLWAETRIPLFEQAVALYDSFDQRAEKYNRVNCGHGYIGDNLFECFQQNLDRYFILLPYLFEGDVKSMNHLRLHNGTIWRWNRPILDFDKDKNPHLRIEHRVMAAGPTVADIIANIALFTGLTLSLIDSGLEKLISFEQAVKNFYAAAQHGLDAEFQWAAQTTIKAEDLLLTLLPGAKKALVNQKIAGDEAGHYLGIIEGRVKQRQTGAHFLRRLNKQFNKDQNQVVERYQQLSKSGLPVHQWQV